MSGGAKPDDTATPTGGLQAQATVKRRKGGESGSKPTAEADKKEPKKEKKEDKLDKSDKKQDKFRNTRAPN